MDHKNLIVFAIFKLILYRVGIFEIKLLGNQLKSLAFLALKPSFPFVSTNESKVHRIN